MATAIIPDTTQAAGSLFDNAICISVERGKLGNSRYPGIASGDQCPEVPEIGLIGYDSDYALNIGQIAPAGSGFNCLRVSNESADIWWQGREQMARVCWCVSPGMMGPFSFGKAMELRNRSMQNTPSATCWLELDFPPLPPEWSSTT
jgi:hypothetical protein